MHSGDLSVLNEHSLTESEKTSLLEVMQKAREFDSTNVHNAVPPPIEVLEGTLYKWTNLMKGWQPRWFCVDHQQGVLHYYMSEEKRKHPPRGSLHLWTSSCAASGLDPLGKDVLLLKATSRAALGCVKECLASLKNVQDPRAAADSEIIKSSPQAIPQQDSGSEKLLASSDTALVRHVSVSHVESQLLSDSLSSPASQGGQRTPKKSLTTTAI